MLHTTHSSTRSRGGVSSFDFASSSPQQLAALDSAPSAPVWTASAREPISLAETTALQASTQQPVISKAGAGTVAVDGGMDSAMLALGFVGAWLIVVGVALLVRRWRNLRSEALFRI